MGFTVDDLTTTATNEVWRNKVDREKRCANPPNAWGRLTRVLRLHPIPRERPQSAPSSEPPLTKRVRRARKEWHYRWGESFGLPPRPASSERSFRVYFEIPDLPVNGVRRNNMVEPTESALKWDAATNHGVVPVRPPSERSLGGRSRMSTKSLPPVRAMSISSSNDRRREMLKERQTELQEQLEQVEKLLKQAAPTSQGTINSEDWRPPTGGSGRSRPPTGGSERPPTGGSERPPTGGSRRPPTGGSARSGASMGRRSGSVGRLEPVAEVAPPTPLVQSEREAVGSQGTRRIPLCTDIWKNKETSPMTSGVGAAMALPGAAMSASFGK